VAKRQEKKMDTCLPRKQNEHVTKLSEKGSKKEERNGIKTGHGRKRRDTPPPPPNKPRREEQSDIPERFSESD